MHYQRLTEAMQVLMEKDGGVDLGEGFVDPSW